MLVRSRAFVSGMWQQFKSDIWFRIAAASALLAIYIPHCLAVSGNWPPVGVYIAVLGGMAAFITMRDKPSVGEKALWIIALTIVMYAEIHNIYTSYWKQLKDAKAISDALHATASRLEESINIETGGNSFCYVAALRPTDAGFDIVLISWGHYPLYGVGVRVTDVKYSLATKDLATKDVVHADVFSKYIGDISPPGSATLGLGAVVYKTAGDHQELNIVFSARNGWWTELLRLRKIHGQWVQAMLVTGGVDTRRYPKSAILEKSVSKDFPLPKLAEDSDWRSYEKLNLPQASY